MSTKETNTLEKYGIQPKEADEKSYLGTNALKLLLSTIVKELEKKSDTTHQHNASEIIEDALHKFVTEEQIKDWSTRSVSFKATKTDLTTADDDIIRNYFETTGVGETPKQDDTFVIETVVADTVYERSSYVYTGEKWEAITGHVDASKVILRRDFVGAGNWDNIGNLTKGSIKGSGLSVEDFILNMVTKRLQPTITSQPSVSGFSLSGAGAVEAGTKITTASFGTARLSTGSYTYGPATGVVAQSYTIDRIAEPAGLNANGITSAASGTDNNGGLGFIIGDDTGEGANVCTSLKYRVTVTHNEGVIANDNLGSTSSPNIKISAGSKQQVTGAYTPFRKFFYGSSSEKTEINSALVRGYTHSNAAYRAQTLTINAKPGDARVLIACVATAKGVTRVINESALNADITDAFKKSTVEVEGANGFKAITYNVWTFEPAAPFEQAATLKVTLG